MNVQDMNATVTQEAALLMLNEYRQHRALYDKRDWEIERIYRAISKGKTIISVHQAIIHAGLNAEGWPKLAVMRADQQICICERYHTDRITLRADTPSRAAEWYFEIPWANRPPAPAAFWRATALLPRIPPQHRPPQGTLPSYHLLWEANWTQMQPVDPYLLRRIGKDAWVVVAAWELTEVEISVLRAHQPRQ